MEDILPHGSYATLNCDNSLEALAVVVYCLDDVTMKVLDECQFRFDESQDLPEEVKKKTLEYVEKFKSANDVSKMACIPTYMWIPLPGEDHVPRAGDVIFDEDDKITSTPVNEWRPRFLYGRKFIRFGLLSLHIRNRLCDYDYLRLLGRFDLNPDTVVSPFADLL